MRCPTCRSYIPEGLPAPVICPQCANPAEGGSSNVKTETTSADPASQENAHTTPAMGGAHAFAPFFSISTRLFHGSPHETPLAADGSISFGAEGFSIVWDNGRGWKKILYRDLESAAVIDGSVRLTIRRNESQLVFFHAWMPTASIRQTRAQIFVELLSRVRQGLSPAEIETYRTRLG